jgi:hypothetical protein
MVVVVVVVVVVVEEYRHRRLEEEGECIHNMQGRKQDCSHQFLGMSANIRNRNTRTCIHSHHRCLGKPLYMHQVLAKHTNMVEAEVVVEEQILVD